MDAFIKISDTYFVNYNSIVLYNARNIFLYKIDDNFIISSSPIPIHIPHFIKIKHFNETIWVNPTFINNIRYDNKTIHINGPRHMCEYILRKCITMEMFVNVKPNQSFDLNFDLDSSLYSLLSAEQINNAFLNKDKIPCWYSMRIPRNILFAVMFNIKLNELNKVYNFLNGKRYPHDFKLKIYFQNNENKIFENFKCLVDDDDKYLIKFSENEIEYYSNPQNIHKIELLYSSNENLSVIDFNYYHIDYIATSQKKDLLVEYISFVGPSYDKIAKDNNMKLRFFIENSCTHDKIELETYRGDFDFCDEMCYNVNILNYRLTLGEILKNYTINFYDKEPSYGTFTFFNTFYKSNLSQTRFTHGHTTFIEFKLF